MVFHPGVETFSALNELPDIVIALERIAEIGGFGLAVFEERLQEGYEFRHVYLHVRKYTTKMSESRGKMHFLLESVVIT